jgi:putative transposase
MPWRDCNIMDERANFIARMLEGERVARLAREFCISRKTAYKIIERYHDTGLEGLMDRSRRPYRNANQLPFQTEALIVRLKQKKTTWGAPKILELLARRYPDVHRPAISTIHAVLNRHGLVKRREGVRATGMGLSESREPYDLWYAD